MSTGDIIRAWKDPDHRDDLTAADHPAGRIEADLTDVTGGTMTTTMATPIMDFISAVVDPCTGSYEHTCNGTCSYTPGTYCV